MKSDQCWPEWVESQKAPSRVNYGLTNAFRRTVMAHRQGLEIIWQLFAKMVQFGGLYYLQRDSTPNLNF